MKVLKKYPNARLDSCARTKLWYDSESGTIIETDLDETIINEIDKKQEKSLEEELLKDFNNLLKNEEDYE
jgi:hypothetical protein